MLFKNRSTSGGLVFLLNNPTKPESSSPTTADYHTHMSVIIFIKIVSNSDTSATRQTLKPIRASIYLKASRAKYQAETLYSTQCDSSAGNKKATH